MTLTFIFIPFIIFSWALSLPAFLKLKKRGHFFFFEPLTYVLTTAFILYLMDSFDDYSKNIASLGNLFFEPLAALVLTIIINYLKLLAPKRMSRWVLSFSSILVLFILTTIMWYFFPGMGD